MKTRLNLFLGGNALRLCVPEYLERGSTEGLEDERCRAYDCPSGWEVGGQSVHQIFRLPSISGNEFRERLRKLGTASNRGVRGIWAARHNNHVHVQHGCPFTTGRCKCTVITGTFGNAKPKCCLTTEPVLCTTELNVGMWEHLDEGPGYRKWLFLQNDRGEPFDFCGDHSIPTGQQPNGRTEKGTRMEKFSPCFDVSTDRTAFGKRHAGEEAEDGSDEPVPKKQKPSVYDTAAAANILATMEWTTSIPTILGHRLMHKEGHTYNCIAQKKRVADMLKAMLDVEYEKMQHMKMDDIREVIGDNPSFGLNKIQTREKSLEGLLLWYLKQNQGCPQKTSEMILMFQNWFDKELGKKNTIMLVGPPSSAKTWIANAWAGLGRWRGSILPWNRNGSQFMWQETVKARVIVHDECRQPMTDVGYLETLKQIYAGNQAQVDKKFETATLSSGAPVIGTCNNYPISNPVEEAAFWARWNLINVQSIHELKDIAALPCNPLALFDLVEWAKEHVNDDPCELVE